MWIANYGNCIPDDAWAKLPSSSREAWQSIPIADCELILGTTDTISSITDTSSSLSSDGVFHRHWPFTRNRDRGKVFFVNQQLDGSTLSTDPTEDSADTNLIDDIIDTYDIDFHTLYNNVVECKKPNIRVAGKHPYHQPSMRADNPVLPPPGNVCCLLANKKHTIDGIPYEVKKAGTTPLPTNITFDDVTYLVKMADLTTYCISSTQHLGMTSALVDHGANGGIAGGDCWIVEVNDQPQCFVNVKGIDGHVMEQQPLVTACAVTQSNRGPVILLINQYTHSGKEHSIHSSPQLEWNEVDVDDKSKQVGGKQCLLTFDGFSIPINVL